jgi:hypothetical protein
MVPPKDVPFILQCHVNETASPPHFPRAFPPVSPVNRLIVATEGDRSVDYQVTFEPIEDGRRLRVTRRITHEDR